jgi:hypothetical protein
MEEIRCETKTLEDFYKESLPYEVVGARYLSKEDIQKWILILQQIKINLPSS